jgi:hypothetical protein
MMSKTQASWMTILAGFVLGAFVTLSITNHQVMAQRPGDHTVFKVPKEETLPKDVYVVNAMAWVPDFANKDYGGSWQRKRGPILGLSKDEFFRDYRVDIWNKDKSDAINDGLKKDIQKALADLKQDLQAAVNTAVKDNFPAQLSKDLKSAIYQDLRKELEGEIKSQVTQRVKQELVVLLQDKEFRKKLLEDMKKEN